LGKIYNYLIFDPRKRLIYLSRIGLEASTPAKPAPAKKVEEVKPVVKPEPKLEAKPEVKPETKLDVAPAAESLNPPVEGDAL